MKKIKTGKIEIGPNEFSPQKGKFRVNMFVDLDVIDQIRTIAASEHMPYQTWINRKLRELIENPKGAVLTDSHISQLIDERIGQLVDETALKYKIFYEAITNSGSISSTSLENEHQNEKINYGNAPSNLYPIKRRA